MELLGIIGIIVGLAFVVIGAMRGVNILFIAPVCAIVVILTNGMPFLSSLITGKASYMYGLGGFVSKFFLIFLLGALLGKYMDDSGAAKSIAQGLMKRMGDGVGAYGMMLAVVIVGLVLTYGGVILYIVVFALIPIIRPLFRRFNLPWHLSLVATCIGCSTVTYSMLPGTPSLSNIIASVALKTPMTAAPIMSMVAAFFTLTWCLLYMKWALAKSQKAGETYVVTAADGGTAAGDKELPSLWLSLTPLILLIGIIFAGSFNRIDGIILPALVLSIACAAMLFRRYVPNQIATLNAGLTSAMSPTILTAAAVGIGSVVVAAPGFKAIQGLLVQLPGGPLINLAVTSMSLSAIMGTATGAIGIIMEYFSQSYLTAGLSPEVIHRIANITCGSLGALPHSGVIFAVFAVMGLTHKEAYKHIFWVVVVGQFIGLIPAVILASFGIV
ncbi:MAG: hypothetical protein PHN75_16545 [Syntrophales bacterium]|nr:hypothetical protein [Syntrophales bacterium]